MNWKENPNLFANGKFKIKFHEDAVNMPTKDTLFKFKADELGWFEGSFGKEIKATLIARPIEDMTDEECREFATVLIPKALRDRWRDMIDNDLLFFNQALKLLSIGVYPFANDEDVEYDPKQVEQE